MGRKNNVWSERETDTDLCVDCFLKKIEADRCLRKPEKAVMDEIIERLDRIEKTVDLGIRINRIKAH